MNIRASRNGCSTGGMGIRNFSFYYVRIENVEYSEYIFLFAEILFIQWRNITNDIIAPVILQLGDQPGDFRAKICQFQVWAVTYGRAFSSVPGFIISKVDRAVKALIWAYPDQITQLPDSITGEHYVHQDHYYRSRQQAAQVGNKMSFRLRVTPHHPGP